MDLLQAGVDQSVIALWLGHESIETTQIYLEPNLELKERMLATFSSSSRCHYSQPLRPASTLTGPEARLRVLQAPDWRRFIERQ